MKIVLIVTNSKRKSLVFVTEELDAYSLEKAVKLARAGEINGAYVVKRGNTTYIRTYPKVSESDEFDALSITAKNLILYLHNTNVTKILPVLNLFIELYRTHLQKTEQFIKPVGQSEVLVEGVKKKLKRVRSIVFAAAKIFTLDPYLLGAIIVDEIARLLPFEEMLDVVGVEIIGGNTSVGIAQVKTDTANNIIKLGLYNPNTKDPKLPFKRLNQEARIHLYTYLINQKHNILFAAAIIKDIVDSWSPIAGKKLTTAVIATLYSQGGRPHQNPIPNERGKQIAGEFYELVRKILKQP